MGKDTLPEYPAILKRQPKNQERLIQLLFRSEPLIVLILEQDLAAYLLAKVHDCLLILSELIQEARRLGEALPDATNFLKETAD